jgi:hypothetical protein
MVGFLLDHFVFKSRRWTLRTKWIVFTLVAGAVVGTFLWFRECAWGIEGAPALEYRVLSVDSAPKLILASSFSFTALLPSLPHSQVPQEISSITSGGR